MELTGADPAVVRRALERREPFPGTAGFAGELDGYLVRDVLGRAPLFFDRENPNQWDWDHRSLENPERLPAGHVHDGETAEQVWSLPTREAETDTDRAVELLREALDVTLSAVDSTELAVAFSGGVDSSLLASRFDGPLYTIGFPDSHDVEAARTGADALGRDVTVVTLDHETLEQAVPEVARVIGRTNAMDVQIALPLYVLAKRVQADGFDRLALGQGADELFGGYAKIERAPEDPRVEATTISGARREVLATLPDQLERDTLALRGAGVEPVAPLLHDRIVDAALRLPGECLVRDGTRKWAFREAASTWLPRELHARDKKALQYGSLVARELDRLARQAGFKRRMDDHVTQYVESRL